ncbi:MAG: LacI family DNA-binding transcriptional regulator [Anaerolineales bacterium]|jgi:DNA-binding LacI/PurR family transcriptional regulator
MTQKSNSVTIREVARQAKVSVATVSRYINRSAPVSNGVAKRLEKVMTNLQYSPHAAARHLASRKTHVVGLLLTNMHNVFFGPMVSGVESAVRENGYNLIVATYLPNVHKDGNLPPIGPHNTDGLIVFANSLQVHQLKQLYEKHFPVVLVHRTPPDSLPIPYVTVENKAATRRLIDHLIEAHGRSRIMFLRGPAYQEDSRWRELGYQASLAAHNLPYDPHLILNGGFERDIAYIAMQEFLSGPHPDFDAIFAGDDDAAYGSLLALQGAGLRVPEDISLVGFDDQKLSAFLTPQLTTVRAPTEAVGRVAGEHLFALLRGATVNRATLLPTDIILRRSCGCAAGINSPSGGDHREYIHVAITPSEN